jgi:hypothetical protein
VVGRSDSEYFSFVQDEQSASGLRLAHVAPWDLDMAFGNWCDHGQCFELDDPTGWHIDSVRKGPTCSMARPIFFRLLHHPQMVAAVKELWRSSRQGMLSDAALDRMLLAHKDRIKAAAEHDLELWSQSGADPFGFEPVCHTEDARNFPGAFAHLREYIVNRVRWIDGNIAELR